MGANAFTRGAQNLAVLSTYLFSKGCLYCLCEGLMKGRHRPTEDALSLEECQLNGLKSLSAKVSQKVRDLE